MAIEPGALPEGVLRAYLDRLGIEAAPPSFEALRLLHRRQVERIPYETLWIHAGEVWNVDPQQSATRIALDGRGGYCYHLNGAFAEVLASLGYLVRRHVGSVYANGMADADALGNHAVLTVDGLPTEDNPSGLWYVDVGLGDALYEPLPLAPGSHRQEPFGLTLERHDASADEWQLIHDPAGGFVRMQWNTAAVTMDVFGDKHRWLSTSPDSGFVRVAMAERRDAAGVDVIRGLVLTRVGAGAGPPEVLTRRPDWFAALADVFDLTFDASEPEVRDVLWTRVLASHRAWEADART